MKDGVIRFHISREKITGPVRKEYYADLEKAREVLYSLELIGFDDNLQAGYGNLSRRLHSNEFLITGSQTGHLSSLDGYGYTIVRSCNMNDHSVSYEGPVVPSSESVSHVALYEANPEIQCVIHIHSSQIWSRMIAAGSLATSDSAEYGTVKLAGELMSLAGKRNLEKPFVIAMKGHPEGVICGGKSIADALGSILELYNQYHSVK